MFNAFRVQRRQETLSHSLKQRIVMKRGPTNKPIASQRLRC